MVKAATVGEVDPLGWVSMVADRFTVELVAGGPFPAAAADHPWDAVAGDRRVGGDGLRFEIAEVHPCLTETSPKRPLMSLESVALATTLDAIRAQIGLVYPGE